MPKSFLFSVRDYREGSYSGGNGKYKKYSILTLTSGLYLNKCPLYVVERN
jgi:hypothetical protein